MFFFFFVKKMLNLEKYAIILVRYDDRGCYMKKVFLFILSSLLILFFKMPSLNALCYDAEINEWASGAKVKMVDFDIYLINEQTNENLGKTMDYAYILTVESEEYEKTHEQIKFDKDERTTRGDIVIKAKSRNSKRDFEGVYVPGHKVYGIVDYTPMYGEIYDITVYGAANSKCPNEVLKTFTYEVPPYNMFYKTQYCENNPEAELCAMYKDTSNMTRDEFNDKMEEYEKEKNVKKDPKIVEMIKNFMLNFGLFILVPFIVIAAFYSVRIRNVKKKEMEK